MNPVLGYVNESDFRFSGRIRNWTPPRWFRLWMIAATRLGDGWGWYAIAAALLSGGGRHHRALAAGAVSAGLATAIHAFLKRRFRRRRPCAIAPHPSFDVNLPKDFSFPSGHSANAFAIGTVLSLAFPLLAPGLALLAGSVAASRVVLGPLRERRGGGRAPRDRDRALHLRPARRLRRADFGLTERWRVAAPAGRGAHVAAGRLEGWRGVAADAVFGTSAASVSAGRDAGVTPARSFLVGDSRAHYPLRRALH